MKKTAVKSNVLFDRAQVIRLLVLFLFITGLSPCIREVLAGDTIPSVWTADNGNGTYTNPLFHDEFSDPDLIRVGEDYYMTGTTMHTMPGLPVLHSKDLVNWELKSYVFDRLEPGPAFRLEEGLDIYGQGIWAPSFRHHDGVFYIFSNVNNYGTHVFTATDPAGPWEHHRMNVSLHDLSVLFDDDGNTYAVWGYNELRMAQLTDDLLDIVPGTEQGIVESGSGAGEGAHIQKIDDMYYIINTNYDPVCYMGVLRAYEPYGPYEMRVISANESYGMDVGWWLYDTSGDPPYELVEPRDNYAGCIPLSQGGIVQVQSGEWWGYSMMDYNSLGRVTALSPVTWEEGWPYFGLPGNLTRSPRTWVKPNTGYTSEPNAPFERDDNFSGPELNEVWQWNHVPVDEKWSLDERNGYLRLHSLPSESFWSARNSLTQRAVGPESYAVTQIDVSGLQIGDVAGLALLNFPYVWIGIAREQDGHVLQFYNQQEQKRIDVETDEKMIWLRAHGDYETDIGKLSYSFDGEYFEEIGGEIIMPYQLRTFQGVRYALFNFNTEGREGGYADFGSFEVIAPDPKHPIPYDQVITLKSIADGSVLVNWRNHVRPVDENSNFTDGNSAHFRVLDRGKGRVALQSLATGGYVAVKGKGVMAEVRIEDEDQGSSSTFQWQDMMHGEMMLLSLHTNRYVTFDPAAESLTSADAPGARPDRKGGSCFVWEVVDN